MRYLSLASLLLVAALAWASQAPGARSGTEAMVKRLADLAREADVKDNPYANHARARYLKSQQLFAPRGKALRLRFERARELLNAGETEEAIRELELLKGFFYANLRQVDPAVVHEIRRYLAIAHLRLGEQENCAQNHTKDSCILPIQGSGIHRIERGSRAAVEEYRSMLKDYPGDLESRWLLNIASMTLGEYPDGVPEAVRIPPEAFDSSHPVPRFVDVAPSVGLDTVGLSGGAIMDDFNGDGLLDIVVSSWGPRDQLRFFENEGDGHFADRTERAGLLGITGGLNLVQADYDNDGFVDVLVLRGAWLGELGKHPNSLLKNNGNGTFTDVTEEAGLLAFHPTHTAAWGDYDNDGWLDLFVGNESTEGSRHPSALYHGKGDGTFEDVADDVGLVVDAYVKGAVWGDYDNDDDLDLYVSVLSGPNLLFRNDGRDEPEGRWRFHEVAEEAGVQKPHDSFPVWFWDFDNDGWLDLFAASFSLERYSRFAEDVAAHYLGLEPRAESGRLYKNDGNGTFSDVTREAGLDQPLFAMGANFGDLDNDGFLDLYLGTGEPELTSVIPNRMFRNRDGAGFDDVTSAGGFGHLQKGHGVAFGDIDHDGDEDVFEVLGGAYEGDTYPNVLFENPGTGGRFVTLVLEGTTTNRSALGARIRVEVTTENGRRRKVERVVTSGGSFGASPLRQHLGLGDAASVDRLVVHWPASGLEQVFRNVEPDRAYAIREGKDRLEPLNLPRFELAARD